MKTTIVVCLSLVAMTGCLGGADTRNEPVKAEQPLLAPANTTSTDEICRPFLQRQRACTSTFIPALVEARVASDNPAGIRARDAASGREALVNEALEEYTLDSQDAAIEALCDDLAQSVSLAKDSELRSSISGCLARQGCDSFVACAVPLNLVRWK